MSEAVPIIVLRHWYMRQQDKIQFYLITSSQTSHNVQTRCERLVLSVRDQVPLIECRVV
jgi:hypothetical protein